MRLVGLRLRSSEKTDVAILPVGSTEQHGPHNPLGTDHLIAAAFSKVVGDRTDVPVLPVIPVGISETIDNSQEHYGCRNIYFGNMC